MPISGPDAEETMNFKKLEIADYPALKPFFRKYPPHLSIYSPCRRSLPGATASSKRDMPPWRAISLIIAKQSEVMQEERHLLLPMSLSGDVLCPEKLRDIADKLGFRSYCCILAYIELHREALENLFRLGSRNTKTMSIWQRTLRN